MIFPFVQGPYYHFWNLLNEKEFSSVYVYQVDLEM